MDYKNAGFTNVTPVPDQQSTAQSGQVDHMTPGPGNYPPFFYPPTALFLWLPFALLNFPTAAALWIATTGTAYAAAIRAILKAGSVIPAIAFPAVMICALFGQNSLFSAALLGGAAATLDRYPLLAGTLIGILTYKPQLAILAPLVLISARRWQALAVLQIWSQP